MYLLRLSNSFPICTVSIETLLRRFHYLRSQIMFSVSVNLVWKILASFKKYWLYCYVLCCKKEYVYNVPTSTYSNACFYPDFGPLCFRDAQIWPSPNISLFSRFTRRQELLSSNFVKCHRCPFSTVIMSSDSFDYYISDAIAAISALLTNYPTSNDSNGQDVAEVLSHVSVLMYANHRCPAE